jgi:hypothetical protein
VKFEIGSSLSVSSVTSVATLAFRLQTTRVAEAAARRTAQGSV